MKRTEYLLTIVVPIYNVERYLRQCLDSLVYQTVDDFKVIMVDDGSTDSSGSIAMEYAQKYAERFSYVRQENAGQGAARNTGFLRVDTPYVEFLDSDDWLLPRTVECVLRTIRQENEDIDILFMNPTVFDMATGEYREWMDEGLARDIFNRKHITNPAVSPEMYALEPSVNRSVWRSDFLRKLDFAFPVGVKWEDVFPHFYLFHHARRCVFVPDVGFLYRVNSGSQITSMSGAAQLDIIPVFSQTLSYVRENGWSERETVYMIQMLVSFVRWSMSMSNRQVRVQLTKGVHTLVKSIPRRSLKAYYRTYHVGRITRLYLWMMRSDLLYRWFANRHREEYWRGHLERLKRFLRWGKR